MNDFSDLVAAVDPAMAIVTTLSGDERAGCLVGFHVQCSITPPRHAIWLSKANHTFRVGVHARYFAVHFPSEESTEVPELFGTVSGDTVDKFARCDWERGPGGVPLLSSCPNRFVATRVTLLDDGGDHVCLVLSPTEVAAAPFRPLRLSQVAHLEPGHDARERPEPATERARNAVTPPPTVPRS
jgi:flavin reductase (DIM6/NTAB) family NADH-FMN oxidoreductase RutF